MSTVGAAGSVLEKYQIKNESNSSKELGKNQFLELLVAQFGLRQRQRCGVDLILERRGIQFIQQVALFHQGALSKGDLINLARHAWTNFYGDRKSVV